VLSLEGDIAGEKGEPKLHLHRFLAGRGGATIGGHLTVSPHSLDS
jgi:predicted DNA-binding protein with PD1-like motif